MCVPFISICGNTNHHHNLYCHSRAHKVWIESDNNTKPGLLPCVHSGLAELWCNWWRPQRRFVHFSAPHPTSEEELLSMICSLSRKGNSRSAHRTPENWSFPWREKKDKFFHSFEHLHSCRFKLLSSFGSFVCSPLCTCWIVFKKNSEGRDYLSVNLHSIRKGPTEMTNLFQGSPGSDNGTDQYKHKKKQTAQFKEYLKHLQVKDLISKQNV